MKKIINALLNIFTMILFGMLEGLWMLFVAVWVLLWMLGINEYFWYFWWSFWGVMILINAVYNKDFWG